MAKQIVCMQMDFIDVRVNWIADLPKCVGNRHRAVYQILRRLSRVQDRMRIRCGVELNPAMPGLDFAALASSNAYQSWGISRRQSATASVADEAP